MSSERNYKRFDFMSALAVLGVIAVLLFEAFFVFEIYNRTDSLQAAPSVEEPAPVG
jgi:hypothetical protein